MAVYVDDMMLAATVGRLTARWSHMWADSEEELVEFAIRLGMRPVWIQRKSVVPFDLTERRRAAAVRLGAIPLDRAAAVKHRRALRAREQAKDQAAGPQSAAM